MNKRIFQHFIIYLVSGGLTKALPFLVLLFIANYLSPSDFGLVSNFNTAAQLFVSIMTLKLGSLVQAEYYRISKEDREIMVANLIYLALMISAILALSIIPFSEVIYSWLKLKYNWLFLAVIVAFGENIFNLRSVLLRLEEKPKIFARYQILYSALVAILSILLVIIIPWTWRGRVWAMVISSILLLGLTFQYFIKRDLLPRPLVWAEIKRYLNFGLPLLPHSITPFLRLGIDKVIITGSIGLAANGLYSFGATLSSVFIMVQVAFFSTYTPHVYKSLTSFEKGDSMEPKVNLLSEGYMAIVGVVLALFLGYFGVKLFFILGLNKEYEQSMDYLPWFLVDVFCLALFQFFSTYIVFSNRTKLLGFTMFSAGILQAFLSYHFIKFFGVKGALYAMLVGDVIRVVTTFFLANKYYPMPWSKGFLHMLIKLQKIASRK